MAAWIGLSAVFWVTTDSYLALNEDEHVYLTTNYNKCTVGTKG